MHNFEIGRNYSRKDVIRIIGLPGDTRGGDWSTGYASYDGDHFLFCNVGTAGRTGHDYDNRFEGEMLRWYAKNGRKLSSESVQALVHPLGTIYVFFRENTRDAFAGCGVCEDVQDTMPVRFLWSLHGPGTLVEDAGDVPMTVPEGMRKAVQMNRYERSAWARKRCIAKWGTKCMVCNFDFEGVYGDLGRAFIHVHHLVELSKIGKEYLVHPEEDLRPVCPNCHAMLHRHDPVLTIEELKIIMQEQSPTTFG